MPENHNQRQLVSDDVRILGVSMLEVGLEFALTD